MYKQTNSTLKIPKQEQLYFINIFKIALDNYG